LKLANDGSAPRQKQWQRVGDGHNDEFVRYLFIHSKGDWDIEA
jgi:hypothetical protein